MNEANRSRLPNLKRVVRKKVNEESKKVEVVLSKMSTSNITQTNDSIYAAATVVTENLGVKTATNEKFIDKMLMKEVKQRKKNVSMAWVDYKKAYDRSHIHGRRSVWRYLELPTTVNSMTYRHLEAVLISMSGRNESPVMIHGDKKRECQHI